jgi:hypothetical protein
MKLLTAPTNTAQELTVKLRTAIASRIPWPFEKVKVIVELRDETKRKRRS